MTQQSLSYPLTQAADMTESLALTLTDPYARLLHAVVATCRTYAGGVQEWNTIMTLVAQVAACVVAQQAAATAAHQASEALVLCHS